MASKHALLWPCTFGHTSYLSQMFLLWVVLVLSESENENNENLKFSLEIISIWDLQNISVLWIHFFQNLFVSVYVSIFVSIM